MIPQTARALMILMFLTALSRPAPAATELQPGTSQEGSLKAGRSNAYQLSLQSGDYGEIKVDLHGIEVIVTVLAPDGNKVRAAKLGPEEQGSVGFVAGSAGSYRVEVSATGKGGEGRYTITLAKVVALEQRLARAPVAPVESPQIRALRAALDAGEPNAIAAFWEEIKTKGAPCIERLDGDDHNMLVTFLWRGGAETKNVGVLWSPFSQQWPDDYQMTRLGETDVWYRTLRVDRRKRFIYRLAPNAPVIHATQHPPAADDTMSILRNLSQKDPLNLKPWLGDPDDPDAPLYKGYSSVEMPDAPPQPWLSKRPGVPEGTVEKHRFSSALMKNEREVAVYTPPGYAKEAKPYGLVVLFDEKPYLTVVPTPTILDNLIAEKRIPPMVAVLLGNPPGARSRELPCNSTFADFLSLELVPWVRRLYNVTADPRETVVGGSSYGGLASAWVGLRHPETFGNILSQSGSYWWTPPRSDKGDFDPDADPSWVARQFLASPRLPLRFYLDAGSDELDLSGHGGHILIPNRHMRDVLLAQGYEVHYQEYSGGHDYLSWRGTLADGLILLMGSPRGPK